MCLSINIHNNAFHVGYEAPSVFGVYGESAVYSDDQTVIECPIVGTPGPDVFYWEYEDGTR